MWGYARRSSRLQTANMYWKYSVETTMVPASMGSCMYPTPSSLQVWALTRIAVEPLCPGFIPTRDSIFRSGEKDPYQCAVQRCNSPSAKA